MNIFALHQDPQICAQYHCDKHVVKMILESTQLLFNGYYENYGYDMDATQALAKVGHYFNRHNITAYKPCHWNHPCSLWTRKYIQNWKWLVFLGYYLCGEYYQRYGKIHKCEAIIHFMMDHPPQLNSKKSGNVSRRPQCTGDYQYFGKPIQAYRDYYKIAKWEIAEYKKGRPAPFWMLPF